MKTATILTLKALAIVVFVLLAMTLAPLPPAYADNHEDSSRPSTTASCELPNAAFLGLPTWYKYLDGEVDPSRTTLGGGVACSPVIDDVNSILPIGLAVLDGLLRFSGVVTVVMIFWASFKFLTSQGNGDAAAEARRTAINAIIGLVIVIIATSFVSFVGNRLSSPNQTSSTPSTNVPSNIR